MNITYAEYRRTSVKNTPQRYFDFLYRHLSHPITYLFLRLRATPNFLSALSVLLNMPAAFFMVIGKPVPAFLIFMVAYIFDFCDGNAARAVMNTTGMSEQKKKLGLLIENFNTNFSLFCLFFSLGWYFSQMQNDIRWFAFAFVIFGVKMVMRYSAHQSSGLVASSASLSLKEKKQEAPKTLFQKSKEQIKFFLRKSFFSFNFYYVVYLLAFVFIPSVVHLVFAFYGGMDMLISFARLYRSFRII